MIPFSVFLGEEYLGDGLMEHPYAYHYLCRHCGVIWCRVIPHRTSYHTSMICNCPEHDDANWAAPVICIDVRFNRIKWPVQALVRDLLYLTEPKSAPVIHNNLPLNMGIPL